MSIEYPRGSVEYVTATVSADFPLDGQAVAIAISRDDSRDWQTATWTGTAGTTRDCRTSDPVTFDPAVFPPRRQHTIYVRVTDSPEVPIVVAGRLTVT